MSVMIIRGYKSFRTTNKKMTISQIKTGFVYLVCFIELHYGSKTKRQEESTFFGIIVSLPHRECNATRCTYKLSCKK